ncbi:hypothetical protein Vretifemale_18928 [Volvox reticuliferus]|uniref:Uncharacterized protein n=1 Tax=Volvox reticuliferus TaxID=1737510 RepID=A0A8J4CWK6_9CHLO|nr:hypothetical protein Vretifemale_18928 [Volvox reticuliferus]
MRVDGQPPQGRKPQEKDGLRMRAQARRQGIVERRQKAADVRASGRAAERAAEQDGGVEEEDHCWIRCSGLKASLCVKISLARMNITPLPRTCSRCRCSRSGSQQIKY